jgi:hypothetical protein
MDKKVPVRRHRTPKLEGPEDFGPDQLRRKFPEASGSLGAGKNPEFDSRFFIFFKINLFNCQIKTLVYQTHLL